MMNILIMFTMSNTLPGTYGRHVKEAPNFGWSEPAATSAPVQDEAIQAILRINQKHILPCPRFLVLSLFKSFSLLPTSPPPLPHSLG